MVSGSNVNRQSEVGPELGEDLERRIIQRTWGQIHRLQVERQGDQFIVRGYSPSYYLKELALSAVQEMGQAVPVHLDIQVAKENYRPSEGRNQP